MRIMCALLLSLIAAPALGQTVVGGQSIKIVLSEQQAQTLVHALDVMLRSEGLRSAGVVLDAVTQINKAVGAAQIDAIKAQIKPGQAK